MKQILTLLLLLVLVGCSSLSGSADFEESFNSKGMAVESAGFAPSRMVASDSYYPQGEGAINSDDRKVIERGSIEIEVKDFDTTFNRVLDIAKENQGFVSHSNTWIDYNEVKRGSITIRVPTSNLDNTEKIIGELGEIESRSRSGEDVTERYTDLTARLKQAELSENRLLDILKSAESVEDLLAVERELNRIRQQIESYQGQINYLDNNIDYSTLSVSLHEPEPIVEQFDVLKSIKNSVNNFFGTILWFIEALGSLIPIAALVGIVWFAIRKVRSGKSKSKKKK